MLTLSDFVGTHRNARVVLIGESHDDPGDCDAVLAIVDEFIKQGRRPKFFMEHFPGLALEELIDQAISSPDSTAAITDLITTQKVPFPGPGGTEVKQTPEQYWGHPAQTQKLVNILSFAGKRGIKVKGHDLLQEDFSPKGYQHWQSHRDGRMVKHIVHFDRTAPENEIAFAFVGKMHLAPQRRDLRAYLRDVYKEPTTENPHEKRKHLRDFMVATDQRVVTLTPNICGAGAVMFTPLPVAPDYQFTA